MKSINRTKKIILYLILFFTVIISTAQTSKDTLIAYTYFKKGDSLLKNKNYKESIIFFNKALPIYEKSKTWGSVVSCYNKVSENLRSVNELEKSLQQTKKALKICNTHLIENHLIEADIYDNIGEYYLKKMDYKNV